MVFSANESRIGANFMLLSSLRYRNFRLLWIGTALSHTGDFMQVMAQGWLVWQLTDSTLLLGIVGFCQALPRLLLSAVGGVIVDRTDRRRLLLVTQGLAMGQAFLFWALVYYDLIQYWQILVLVVILGAVNSIHQTARHSLIRIIIPRDQIVNAVALHSSLANFTKIVGPSLAGVLISIIGVAGCLFINALSFSAIIVSLWMMDLPPWEKDERPKEFWSEFSEGFQYVRSNHRIYAALLMAYILALLGSPYSRFLPIFATDILHMGAVGFGLLLSAPAIGAVISGLFLASLGKFRLRNYVLFAIAISFSLFLILFALSRSMVLSLAFLTLVGASQMTFRSMLNARLQMETPSHLLGRVLSLLFMDRGLWSFGTLLIGSLATLIGTPWAIVLCGSCCAITAVIFIYSDAVRSRARDKLRSEMPG